MCKLVVLSKLQYYNYCKSIGKVLYFSYHNHQVWLRFHVIKYIIMISCIKLIVLGHDGTGHVPDILLTETDHTHVCTCT